jgi:hypothetical protein
VHWAVVRNMGLAWVITMPASAVLGVIALELWRSSRDPSPLVPAGHTGCARGAA